MGTLIGDMNVGPPPSPLAAGFLPWCRGYRDEIMDEIDSVPRTNFYFSQSGDDVTGDGSQNSPWQSIAKMQETLDGGSFRRCLLEGGNTWTTDDQLTISKEGGAIGRYGSGNLPRLQQAGLLVEDDVTWTPSSGAYYTDVTAFTYTLGRVIYEEDSLRNTMLVKQSSVAGVQGNVGSYFHDSVADRLYINIGADPSGTAFRMFKTDLNTSTGNGILMTTDMAWVDSVEMWGFGLSGTTTCDQVYHIKMSPLSADFLQVASNCEAYVYRCHSISAFSSNGGICHVENCRSGWGEHTSSPNPFNFYNGIAGLLQASCWRNESTAGVIPNTGTYGKAGYCCYAHGDNAAVRFSLCLMYENVMDYSSEYANSNLFYMDNGSFPGDENGLDDHVDFAVGHTLAMDASSTTDGIRLMSGVWVNNHFTLYGSVGCNWVIDNLHNGPLRNNTGWWCINCFFEYDTDNALSPYGLFRNNGLKNFHAHFYYCYFTFESSVAQSKKVQSFNDSGAGQGEYYVDGCIFYDSGTGQSYLGLQDNDARLNDFGYYGILSITGWNGFASVTNATEFATPPEDRPPTKDDEWFEAAGSWTTHDGNLEYDANGAPRSPTASSMGRFEPRRVTGGRGAMTVMITPDMKRRIEQGDPSIGRG